MFAHNAGDSNEEPHIGTYPRTLHHVGLGCRQFGHVACQRGARHVKLISSAISQSLTSLTLSS